MKLLPPPGSEGKEAYLVDRGDDEVRVYSSETSNTALLVMSLLWIFLAWLLYVVLNDDENPFATKCVLSLLLGSGIYFVTSMMVASGTWRLDRIKRTFVIEDRMAGILRKREEYGFDDWRCVEVRQHSIRMSNGRYETLFQVFVILSEKELPFTSSKNREQALHQAEGLARFVGVSIEDKTKSADGDEFDPAESFDRPV